MNLNVTFFAERLQTYPQAFLYLGEKNVITSLRQL